MRVLSIGLLLLALAGCSEPPQKEIDEAKSAIDAARAAGADQYAAEEYAGAAATLEKARAAVDERDYRQALSYAIDARQRAIEASRMVPEVRARLNAAAETELKLTSDSVAHLDSALRAAGDAGVRGQDRRPAHDALVAAKRVLQEARTALDARKYVEANAMLRGVREKLDAEAKAIAQIAQRPKAAKGRRH